MTGIRSRWPATVLVFLGYAVLLLAVAGIVLRLVIDQAINAPVSPIGLVWMVLLGCTVFTVTPTLQRKQAAHNPALGLSTCRSPRPCSCLSPRSRRSRSSPSSAPPCCSLPLPARPPAPASASPDPGGRRCD